jgi:hypothetical protein
MIAGYEKMLAVESMLTTGSAAWPALVSVFFHTDRRTRWQAVAGEIAMAQSSLASSLKKGPGYPTRPDSKKDR